MEYIEDKFALKSQAMKASEYYMDQVMESLDSAQYFNKPSPKCAQAFGLQGAEHRSPPCGDQSGESELLLCSCERRGAHLHIREKMFIFPNLNFC